MNSFSTRPAYSLIFAFLLMTVLLIAAGSAAAITRSKLALYNDLEGSEQALLAAQSAAEMGIAALKQDFDGDGEVDELPGYEGASEAGDEIICEGSSGGATGSDCETSGSYTIYAEASPGPSDLYYLPMFGTGTAGLADDCSILDYVDADPELVDVDNPCNWNKLLYGQSVTIPLFDTDDDTGEAVLPADFTDFNGWSLKIRTPCSNASMASDCDGEDRYVLDEDGSVSGGDSVVFWQLVAESTDGDHFYLIPDDSLSAFTGNRSSSSNTEIYESLINDASLSNYTVLDAPKSGSSKYEDIYHFCIGDTDGDSATTVVDFSKIYLQLNIVSNLETSSSSVPYLEWQVETDASESIADNKALVLGEGTVNLFSNYFSRYFISHETTGQSANVYTLSN